MKKVVTGVFATRREAQHAVHRLVDAGFVRGDLSVLLSHPDPGPRDEDPAPRDRLARAAEGAWAGGTIGSALGGILGGVAAVGSIAIPGVGLVAAGPIVAALAGAGAGGATGSVIGALLGLGVCEAEARDAHHEVVDRERIVVAIETTPDRTARAVAIVRGEGCIEVSAS